MNCYYAARKHPEAIIHNGAVELPESASVYDVRADLPPYFCESRKCKWTGPAMKRPRRKCPKCKGPISQFPF